MKLIRSFIYLLFTCFQLQAQSYDSNLLPNDFKLSIKPNICVAPRGENSCISSIDINWKSSKKGNYCLSNTILQENLFCWENKTSGYYQHKLIFNKDILYNMSDEYTHRVLIEAMMKFKVLKPHRNYKKRRSRFPWSLTSL